MPGVARAQMYPTPGTCHPICGGNMYIVDGAAGQPLLVEGSDSNSDPRLAVKKDFADQAAVDAYVAARGNPEPAYKHNGLWHQAYLPSNSGDWVDPAWDNCMHNAGCSKTLINRLTAGANPGQKALTWTWEAR